MLQALGELGIPHRLVGAPRPVRRVCSLRQREAQGLYYYAGDAPGPIDDLEGSVIMCRPEVARSTDTCSAIAVEGDVQLAFYRLCARLFRTGPEPGVHSTAIIDPEARIGDSVHIGPYAVIGKCEIGAGSVVNAHVVVMDGSIIGERVTIEPNSCIGATGVAWVWAPDGTRIVLPQLGGVHIDDEVFIGTDVTVVRGMFNEMTIIGKGCMIAHGTKIGHSAVLGEGCHLANNVSIAGSAKVGARSFLGSGCSIRPHTTLAEATIVGVGAAVVADSPTPGAILAGVPARRMPDKERPAGMPRPMG
ncbi:MAG: hypothetical protein JNJ64_13440 [Flavobacteriales bacterium]|nr:hypothetical protein [Flavobacteriales bacterium]